MRKLTLVDGLIGLVFVIGLAVRLAGMGKIPLNDAEAQWAMQALQIAKGGSHVGAEAGVVLWSSWLFRILGGGNFLARLIPALSGSLIILFPIFLQKKVGPLASVLFAVGLALDPLLVGVSRQVDGLSIAIGLAGLVLGFWYLRKDLIAGISLGFFLISGPSAWLGLSLLALVVIINWLFLGEKKLIPATQENNHLNWKLFLTGLGISLFAGGTLLMTTPTGISGAMEGMVAFLESWKTTREIPLSAAIVLMAMINYLLMPSLFAVGFVAKAFWFKNKQELRLAAWLLAVILFFLVYPGFEIRQLAWLAPFLWIMVAIEISKLPLTKWTGPSILMMVVTLVMLVFVLINLNTLVNNPEPLLRLSAIGISLLIILLCGFLVWWGWSFEEARRGLVLGVLIILCGLTLTSTWRSAGLNGKVNLEMITQSPAFVDADLMSITISDISEWNTGEREFIDVVLIGQEVPAIDWLLRDFVHYKKLSSITAGENPGIILARPDELIDQTEPYTGQEFTLREIPVWSGLTSRQWIGWLMRRDLSVNTEAILLWARSDLFPGATVPEKSEP